MSFKCDKCDKFFPTKQGRAAHQRVHYGTAGFLKDGVAWNKGLTADICPSLSRETLRSERFDVDDDGSLRRKFINKRTNAGKAKIDFNLTIEECAELLRDANLKASDWGYTGNCYDIARYNDVGPYDITNCRFLTHKENIHERKRK